MPTSPAQARHDLQHRILRAAAPWLTVYYALICAAHAAWLTGPLRTTMVVVAGGSCVVFAAMAVLRDRRLLRDHAYLWSLVMALLVVANAGAHLWSTGEVVQTTNLLLTVVGAAILLTSIPLFALTLALCAAVFAATALTVESTDPTWAHFGFALFTADALATVVFAARRATHTAQVNAEAERDRISAENERRAAEAKAHGQRYEGLAQLSPAAIVVHRDGVVLFANRAAAELIGTGDALVLVDSRLYDLFPPEDEERIAAWSEATIAGEATEQTVESRLRALTGPWPYVELETAPITWKEAPAAILVATDITDRRELIRLQDQVAEVAERKAQSRLRKALDALDAGEPNEARTHLQRALTTLDEFDELARLVAEQSDSR